MFTRKNSTSSNFNPQAILQHPKMYRLYQQLANIILLSLEKLVRKIKNNSRAKNFMECSENKTVIQISQIFNIQSKGRMP